MLLYSSFLYSDIYPFIHPFGIIAGQYRVHPLVINAIAVEYRGFLPKVLLPGSKLGHILLSIYELMIHRLHFVTQTVLVAGEYRKEVVHQKFSFRGGVPGIYQVLGDP